MPTPHINAPAGAFAPTILLPGDPLRAKYIANTFLDDAECVTDVRIMLGYTGTFEGKRLSVMGSGMGIPSASIYGKELICEYGARNLIRIGSCGALGADLQLRDIVIGMGACTDSKVNRARFLDHDFAAIADYTLLETAVGVARQKGVTTRVGNLFSIDLFYNNDPHLYGVLEKYGVLAVEMEAAGLYGVCAEYGARGLAICSVSDHIRTGEQLDSEAREKSFNEMIAVALGTATQLSLQ